MRSPFAATSLAILLLASGLVTASTLAPMLSSLDVPKAWIVEPVSLGVVINENYGLSLDSLNRPHIAFREGITPASVVVGVREASGWSLQTIANGAYPDLDLDSNDLAHVSYVRSRGFMDQDLVHATQTSTGWTFENIDTGGILYTHIAVDTNDAVHIVYKHISSPIGIRYAVRNAGGWTIESVASSPLGIAEFDMAIGPDNEPRILWTTTPGEMTLMTRSPGGGWVSEPVDMVHGFNPSLTVDSLGQPHAIYVSSDGVRYAKKTSIGWSYEVMDARDADWNRDTGIALDALDRPHVVWASKPNGPGFTRYATLRDGVWRAEDVNHNEGSTHNGAIAIDGEGFPHILYNQFEYSPRNTLGTFDLYYAQPLLRAIVPRGVLP